MSVTRQRAFAARPESIKQVRDFTAGVLEQWGLEGRAEDIRLCASELATNALVHGTRSMSQNFLVRLDADEGLVRLEVHDSQQQHPTMRRTADVDPSGRGLILVAAIADEWGVRDREPEGKVVWSCFKSVEEVAYAGDQDRQSAPLRTGGLA
ncbi:ATP-binding protein [Streptomyces sp. NPDC058254]|uniref:ATP-binding protein n=1 Tax=unclassified Streptomyces TaxID=2593676 RepID=UPI0036E9CE0D